MFTGIIHHLGTVAAVQPASSGMRLELACPQQLLEGSAVGDSIAVNGCCLTLVARKGDIAQFDLAPETLTRTVPLKQGDPVHLETSLRAGDLIGGHLMFGHVDGAAKLIATESRGECLRLKLAAPAECAHLIAAKGSVALAGVSLTVAACENELFEVELIPQTIASTVLAKLAVDDQANFEADMLARYAARAQEARHA